MTQLTNSKPKPLPVVNSWAKPFWEGCAEHRLLIQRCSSCNQSVFYPRIACPHCSSDTLNWEEASGRGKIYSYTIVENNAPSAFAQDVPYVVAVIKLQEGVQMLSNIVDCDFDQLECELPVEVVFEELNEDFTLPKFRPIKDQ